MQLNHDERAEAARTLARLLPGAKASLRKPDWMFRAISRSAKAGMQYFTAERLAGVHIHQAPLGGWYGDVLFRDVPPGYPDCLGTPVERPVATRKEAEDGATTVLAMALANRPATTDLPPVFRFFEYSVSLVPSALEHLSAVGWKGFGSLELAIARMDLQVDANPAVRDLEGLKGDDRALLLSLLHLVSFDGVLVYPPRQPGKPEIVPPGAT